MRLIDADALWLDIANRSACLHDCCPRTKGKKGVLSLIDEAPIIEAEPVRHGRWVRKKHKIIGNSYDYVCSVCGCDYALAEYDYCPNCGAKMDGKEDA